MKETETLKNQEVPDSIAWKALQNIILRFRLSQAEGQRLMGDMPHSSYYKGLSQRTLRLNRDQRARISYLLGIYKSLRILFNDSEQAMTWIDRPNTLPPFNGTTPREYMLEGSLVRLSDVRRFLDFWRGY